MQHRTNDNLPIGVWFTKGYSTKTEGEYIRIQLTYLEKKEDGSITREWSNPPTFCSVNAFKSFLETLSELADSQPLNQSMNLKTE